MVAYGRVDCIKMGDDLIKRVIIIKVSVYLGVHVDEHLSWANHDDHLAKKISSGFASLKQGSPFVPKEMLI